MRVRLDVRLSAPHLSLPRSQRALCLWVLCTIFRVSTSAPFLALACCALVVPCWPSVLRLQLASLVSAPRLCVCAIFLAPSTLFSPFDPLHFHLASFLLLHFAICLAFTSLGRFSAPPSLSLDVYSLRRRHYQPVTPPPTHTHKSHITYIPKTQIGSASISLACKHTIAPHQVLLTDPCFECHGAPGR